MHAVVEKKEEMVRVLTSELTGGALNWAAGMCNCVEMDICADYPCFWDSVHVNRDTYSRYSPTTKWELGGPIIDREGISFSGTKNNKHQVAWVGSVADYALATKTYGDTNLIASMRCYVSSKMGPEIELPLALWNTSMEIIKPNKLISNRRAL